MSRQRIQRPSATVANPTPTLLSRSTATLDAPGGISAIPERRPYYDFGALPLYAPAPPIQRKRQGAPLPHKIKAGIEKLSGRPMDEVRVHYGSPAPARFAADAHTQGSEIHLGPGQERLLPHEAWHVVQQKQGRVKPTSRTGGHSLNEDPGLEHEADSMGVRATAEPASRAEKSAPPTPASTGVVQLGKKKQKKQLTPAEEAQKFYGKRGLRVGLAHREGSKKKNKSVSTKKVQERAERHLNAYLGGQPSKARPIGRKDQNLLWELERAKAEKQARQGPRKILSHLGGGDEGDPVDFFEEGRGNQSETDDSDVEEQSEDEKAED